MIIIGYRYSYFAVEESKAAVLFEALVGAMEVERQYERGKDNFTLKDQEPINFEIIKVDYSDMVPAKIVLDETPASSSTEEEAQKREQDYLHSENEEGKKDKEDEKEEFPF